jgi:hypothetical protein
VDERWIGDQGDERRDGRDAPHLHDGRHAKQQLHQDVLTQLSACEQTVQLSNELEHELPQASDEQGERRDVLGGVQVMVEKHIDGAGFAVLAAEEFVRESLACRVRLSKGR